MKTHPLQELLASSGLSQADLARGMGLDPSTLSNKLNGLRRWTQSDINAALGFFRERGVEVVYEQLFGAELVEAAS